MTSAQRSKKRRDEKRAASVPGVYGLYIDNTLVYIGESQYCQLRWYVHLNETARGSKSDIGWDRSRKHDYEFKMLAEIDDPNIRKAVELKLIAHHMPALNAPFRYIDNIDDISVYFNALM